MYTLIHYETQKFIDAFNTIFFNQLLRQVDRNDLINFTEIETKISTTEEAAVAFYEQINQQVSSDSDAANGFLTLVLEQLFIVLQKELIEQFDDKILSIDSFFKKEDNMNMSNKVFQES